MRAISVLALISLLISCSKEVDDFGARLMLNWHSAHKVILHGKEYFNTDKEIVRPYNTWQALIEVEILDNLAEKLIRQCLVYRVPYQEIEGILKLIELKGTESCQESYQKLSIAEIVDIDKIKLFYDTKKISQKKRIIDPFTFGLELDSTLIRVPLLNVKGQRDLKRYSDGRKNSFNRGVSYWPFSSKRIDLVKRKAANRFLGKLTDRYLDRTLIMCEKVSDDCKVIGASRCDRCRYGWFEALGSKCRSRRIKFCRPNSCGDRGEPACIRGDSYAGKQEDFGCVGGSNAGFCKPGLGTYCDGNGILICL